MVARTFNFTVASASTAPAYMQGLASLQSRNLTGVYGPESGVVTFAQAMPSPWNSGDGTFQTRGVFHAWSGGRADLNRKRLLIHGAGHSDGANNGLHYYDFNGSRPAGWGIVGGAYGTAGCTLSNDSAVPAASAAYDTYNDGKVGAVHTYDQTWYDPNLDRYYRFGGARYLSGNPSGRIYYYDFARSQWTLLLDNQYALTNGATVIGKSDGTKMLHIRSTAAPVFVTPAGAWQVSGSAIYTSEQIDPVSAHDSTRDRWLSIGYNVSTLANQYNLVSVNWDANTFTRTTFTPTGATEFAGTNLYGASVFYDAQRDSFWVFGGRGQLNTGAITYLLEVNASTFAVTRHNLTGDAITVQDATYARGSHNKHVWFPQWRIVASCQSPKDPPFIIRIPD